jgi:hypothetical protein
LAVAILLIVAAVTLVIVLGEWPFVERAIALEDAPIAWLQSTLLAASAVTCLCHSLLSRRSAWYAIAGVLFVLALDERFMGHERVQEWVWLNVFDGDSERAGRWPNVPTLIEAAVVAASVTWLARQSPSGFPLVLIRSALAIGAGAVAMDFFSDNVGLQIVEELLELLAETLFFIGLLLPLGVPRAELDDTLTSRATARTSRLDE